MVFVHLEEIHAIYAAKEEGKKELEYASYADEELSDGSSIDAMAIIMRASVAHGEFGGCEDEGQHGLENAVGFNKIKRG